MEEVIEIRGILEHKSGPRPIDTIRYIIFIHGPRPIDTIRYIIYIYGSRPLDAIQKETTRKEKT